MRIIKPIVNIKINQNVHFYSINFYSYRSIFLGRQFLIGHFFSFFFLQVTNKFFYGFLIKPYKLYCFIKTYFLHFCLFIFKKNLMLQFVTLSDLCVVDHPNILKYRFSLTYVLISSIFGLRFFLKLFINNFMPLLSIIRLYYSAN